MTLMKVASVRLATALAHRVLPVPGGPKRRTPLGGSIPRLTKRSGWEKGMRIGDGQRVSMRQQELRV